MQWLHSAVHSSGRTTLISMPGRPGLPPRPAAAVTTRPCHMQANARHAGLTSTRCRPEAKEDWIRPVDPGRQDAHARIGRHRVAAQPDLLAGPRLEHRAVQLLHADPAHLQGSGLHMEGASEQGEWRPGGRCAVPSSCCTLIQPIHQWRCAESIGQAAKSGLSAWLGAAPLQQLHWRDSSKHA